MLVRPGANGGVLGTYLFEPENLRSKDEGVMEAIRSGRWLRTVSTADLRDAVVGPQLPGLRGLVSQKCCGCLFLRLIWCAGLPSRCCRREFCSLITVSHDQSETVLF